jgi:hypothetical protein
MLGAKVERTAEGVTLVEVSQPRRFYRLTGKDAPDAAWSDPLQDRYEYPREYRSRRKAEKLYCPGGLPRTAKTKLR